MRTDELRCPLGKPGDRLWVRESFRLPAEYDRLSPKRAGQARPFCPTRYEADGTTNCAHYGEPRAWGKLRPSIHMPRWASRITLAVTGVRVERVQDISDRDALAEGLKVVDHVEPRASFEDLWNGIYAADGLGWVLP